MSYSRRRSVPVVNQKALSVVTHIANDNETRTLCGKLIGARSRMLMRPMREVQQTPTCQQCIVAHVKADVWPDAIEANEPVWTVRFGIKYMVYPKTGLVENLGATGA